MKRVKRMKRFKIQFWIFLIIILCAALIPLCGWAKTWMSDIDIQQMVAAAGAENSSTKDLNTSTEPAVSDTTETDGTTPEKNGQPASLLKAEKLIDVPYINQSKKYPTGCEVVSATMLLNYYNFDLTVDDLIGYLNIGGVWERDGEWYGNDPNKCFIGMPYDSNSFGCYAPVIERALYRVAYRDYSITNQTGLSMEELITSYIDQDIPVLVWCSINLKETSPGRTWKISGTDESFTWIRGEHCMVLVGYDEDHYILNDPYQNNGVMSYSKKLFEKRYEELGRQAVAMEVKEQPFAG